MTADELRAIPLFAGLSDDGVARLAASAAELEAGPGQMLTQQDAPGAGMFVLLEGGAAVELRSGTYEIGPGEFFGELALLAPGSARTARVRAITPSRCLAVPRDDFLALVESEPTLALALLRGLAERLAARS